MWCPSCQSRSPLVAVQPEGLICARCQVEVEFGDRVTGQQAGEVKLTAPRHLNSAAEPGDFAEQLSSANRMAVAAELRSGRSTTAQSPPHRTRLPSVQTIGLSEPVEGESDPPRPAGPSPFERNPGHQPLFRFDAAHPPVGGRTEAAIELQRQRCSHGQRSSHAAPVAREIAAESPASSVPEVKQSALRTELPVVESPGRRGQIESCTAEELIRVRELANFPQAEPVKPVAPVIGAESEFAIRRVPRSFLFPRRTNRWPGRICLLSGGLFLSGQSLLLTAFLRSEPLGVATGVLATATAFALALYVIARYCDEDLER